MSFALQTNTMVLPPPPRLLARHRGYSFHEERFSWLRGDTDAEHLFLQHYAEASANLTTPLSINWTMFERLELAGIEVCVTVRRNGELVGYAVYFLAPHMHYDLTIADADVFFLDPAHRSGWLGVRLLRISEELLREKGVGEVWNRVKLHVKPGRGGRDLGVLFRFLGYRPVETSYRKRIA
jgi:GNAT superfamily N-acetyltransferase